MIKVCQVDHLPYAKYILDWLDNDWNYFRYIC